MTDNKVNNNEDFNADNIPSSSWMKFVKIGDYIKGTLAKKPYIKTDSSGVYKDQYVYDLVNVTAVINGLAVEDKEMSLGVSEEKDFVWSRLSKAKVGQRIGLMFEKELPAPKKGFNPVKSLMPNVWGMDPNFIDPMLEEFNAGAQDIKEPSTPAFE